MNLTFPFYHQRDAMDCGPACLMMIAAAHGRKYALNFLRERSFLSREGVSAQGIMEAAENIGFRTMTVKVPFLSGAGTACLLNAPLPCIAHWNQNHFIVIYKASGKHVWVADPGLGKIKVSRNDFEKSWVSDAGQGILVLLEPTPAFYQMEQPVQPKIASRIAYLGGYLQPWRNLIVQLCVGMALGSVLTLIFPFLTQSIVDFGIDNHNIDFIYLILAAQLVLFFSQIVVQFIQSRILLFIGTRINVAMVSDFLAKLTRLPIGFFDTKMTGDLIQRINDQGRIETFLTNSALPILFSMVNFITFSLILLFYNVTIFTLFYIAAFLYITWIFFFMRRRMELDYIRFQQSGENNNNLIELIQGMQEIKLQGSERKRRWIWAGVQANLFRTNLSSLRLSQWQDAGGALINQSKNILITFLAAKAVIDGQMTLGMMLATQYMVGQLDAPLQQFIHFMRAAQDAKISLERMNEIQDQPDEDAGEAAENITSDVIPAQNNWYNGTAVFEKHASGSNGDLPVRGSIHFENVSFRYNHLSNDVLKNITLTIPQGKITAIVGNSGSGKTTLVKLMLGFYQPTQGNIRIQKILLSAITPSVWRRYCGTVMQDGFVFSDTIANNISECDERPDRFKLENAVEIANIREFIETLPLGFNTKIGSLGNGISLGQRQRLLIARAVYKNPDYLFFDEATNALDANNEKEIVNNLNLFFSNSVHTKHHGFPDLRHTSLASPTKTVVVVAHRLSTVRHADQIVVLDNGEVREVGTHDELVRAHGAYFHLVKNQLELGV